MAVLPVYVEPHPALRKIAKTVVGGVTAKLQELMDDMLETMQYHKGVGIAITQVFDDSQIVELPPRIFLLQIPESLGGDNKPMYFVNPVITTSGKLVPYEEGCLSVPAVSVGEKVPQGEKGIAKGVVMRPEKVSVSYLDYDGNPQVMEAENCLLAVALQHEMKHLDGGLFIDLLSDTERARVMKEHREYIKNSNPADLKMYVLADQQEKVEPVSSLAKSGNPAP
ncbi:MAG: peptide deformylase [Alphaproteobacteria bacterium]|nr:peptide deformylase [Alphaproteobacteria bacterium]